MQTQQTIELLELMEELKNGSQLQCGYTKLIMVPQQKMELQKKKI